MSQKALLALLVGQFAFSTTVVQATDYVIPVGDAVDNVLLENGDTLANYGEIAVGVPDVDGVSVALGAKDITIDNYGQIKPAGGMGIRFIGGNSATLTNHFTAIIEGASGVYGEDVDHLEMTNFGIVGGLTGSAIRIDGGSDFILSNWGTIVSGDLSSSSDALAVWGSNAIQVLNKATGEILGAGGESFAVTLEGGDVFMENAGIIDSGQWAVRISGTRSGALNHLNGATISGDVLIAAAEAALHLETGGTINGDVSLFAEKSLVHLYGSGSDALSTAIGGDLNIDADEIGLLKTGSGTWSVDRQANFTELIIRDGTLEIELPRVFESARASLEGGILQSNTYDTYFKEFAWSGGSIFAGFDLEGVIGTRKLDILPGGGHFIFDLNTGTPWSFNPLIITQGTANYDLGQLTATVHGGNPETQALFGRIDYFPHGIDILYALVYERADGEWLQNSAPVNTPETSMFVVETFTQTGGEHEDNIIRGLIFEDGAELLIHNALEVTNGILMTKGATARIDGEGMAANLYGDSLIKLGDGELIFGKDLWVVASDRLGVFSGRLVVDGSLEAEVVENYGELVINNSLIIGEYLGNYGTLTINSVVWVPSGEGVYNMGELLVTAGSYYEGDLVNQGDARIDGTVVADSVYNEVDAELIVNGAVEVGDAIYNFGYLGGSGFIYGTVANMGVLNPGNSPGTMTIVGDLIQAPGGVLAIEVGSASNHDILEVTGTAYLTGTLAFAGNLSFGDSYRFLEAGAIVGDFDTFILPDGFRARFTKTGTSYTALMAPESYTQLAGNDNHRSVARALDRFIYAGGDRGEVSLALDHLKADEYAKAFQQISPALHETIGTQAINLSQQQGRLLQQRVGTARYGLRGSYQSNTVAPALQTDRDGKSVYQSKAVKEVVTTVEEENRWSAWIEGNGVFSRVTQAHQVPNGRTRAGGFIVGTDYAWNLNFITGLFAGYEGLETKYADESRATMNGARFGGYGTYTLDTGLYFDGVVWGGAGEYEVHRRIDFGSIDRTARSTQQTGEISAIFGTGYDWKPGNWIVGPTASVQYTYLGIDGFEEDGAKSLNLDINRQRIQSLRSNLGARLAYRYEINENAVIVPELRASWEYEFLNDARNIDGQLGGKSITYRTEAGERASLFAGAGINALFNNRVSLSAHYNVDLGRSDDTAHLISASFGVQW